ncbi:MAG TPA: tripartite tricarboxylate transporter substrate binding protein [Paenalcaligenes sp.]|nr:tripartite tricarboxylate transporter substrate binding protein [Paenalcaligenes sp.]
MSSYKKSVLGVLGAAAFMLAAGPAMADYPDKPIQVIVPYSAGGDSDLTTRIWADAVEKEIGSPIVVVNRPGGSGVVGTAFVANAKKDGYTLVNAGLGNVQVVPNFSQTPYDFDSFEPIVKMTAVPLAVVVSTESPYETFDDFVAAAKEKSLTMGSFGAASSGTVLGNIIADQMGYEPKYVHADNTAESVAAVVGGHLDSAVSFPPGFDSHLKSGKVRVLAINERMPHHDESIPLFSDYDIEGSFEGWSGIFAPKGVPNEVIETLVQATEKVMQDPKVIAAFENVGAIVDFRHGDEWVEEMQVTYDAMQELAQQKGN